MEWPASDRDCIARGNSSPPRLHCYQRKSSVWFSKNQEFTAHLCRHQRLALQRPNSDSNHIDPIFFWLV
jgi:hypothetical protein